MPDASGRFKGISVPALPWQQVLVVKASPKQSKLAAKVAAEHEGRTRVVLCPDVEVGNIYSYYEDAAQE